MTNYLPLSSTLTPDWVLGLLWNRWRLLIKFIGTFAVAGVLYALLAPVEYKSGAKLMPEFQAGSAVNLKRFGALAELVGIDLEGVNNTEAIRPDLYPDVLTSTPFLLTVLNQPVTTADKTTYPTLVAFLTKIQAAPLTAWFTNAPQSLPKPESLGHTVRLSKEQEDILKELRKRIISDLDPQSGLITIQVKMPDAEVAAQVCQAAIAYLKRYVFTYRTGKTQTNLNFISQRRAEAEARYNRALGALSAYTDQNRFLYAQSARTAGKRLEAEYELAQTLYADLSRQYEQTLLKVQEETPVLSVLEPPVVPARRSEPRRILTVLAFVGVGLGLGVGWVVLSHVSRPPTSGFIGATGRGRPEYE